MSTALLLQNGQETIYTRASLVYKKNLGVLFDISAQNNISGLRKISSMNENRDQLQNSIALVSFIHPGYEVSPIVDRAVEINLNVYAGHCHTWYIIHKT